MNDARDEPYIDHADPLPPYREPAGRWADPYLTRYDDEDVWTCHVRRPLTTREELRGLLPTLVAGSEERLRELQHREDERAATPNDHADPIA